MQVRTDETYKRTVGGSRVWGRPRVAPDTCNRASPLAYTCLLPVPFSVPAPVPVPNADKAMTHLAQQIVSRHHSHLCSTGITILGTIPYHVL